MLPQVCVPAPDHEKLTVRPKTIQLAIFCQRCPGDSCLNACKQLLDRRHNNCQVFLRQLYEVVFATRQQVVNVILVRKAHKKLCFIWTLDVK